MNGALFHRRNFAGHSDDDARMYQHAAVVRLLNKIRQHFFGDFEVGDDAILHRLDGDHIARRAAEHLFCFAPDGNDFAAGFVDGHDRRLVHHDTFAGREHQRIRRPKINGEVGRKQTKDRPQVVTVLIHPPAPREENFSAVQPTTSCLAALRSRCTAARPTTPLSLELATSAKSRLRLFSFVTENRSTFETSTSALRSSPSADSCRHGGFLR